jgi:HSP20 family protein
MARDTQQRDDAAGRQQPTVRANQSEHERGLTRSDPWSTSWSGGPFGFMRRMMDEMDRMFEDLGFGGAPATGARPETGARSWTPRVDVKRHGDALVVRADLPGVRQEDVEVEVEAGALRLRGERRDEREEGEGQTHRREVVYGTFVRTIPLPEGADVDKATARFSNGVLEVTIPLPHQQRGRRIEIGTGAGGTTTH